MRTAKAAALSPAAARVAAAAGVKPAALVTRIGPHDRAIPKPAFELTSKKLDPKTATAGPRKAAVRSKVKKTAKPWKPSAKAKKAASTAKPATAAGKKFSGSGGQKPSPGVAKNQANQGAAQ